MSVQKERTVEDVPQVARLCETVPSDNVRIEWEMDGKEVTIISATRPGDDYSHLATEWITASEDDLEYLEEMR